MRWRTPWILALCAALVLPWGGWQLVRQIESLLREGQERAQKDAATAVARALMAISPGFPDLDTVWYVHRVQGLQVLDGHGDEYAGLEATSGGQGRVSLVWAEDESALYGYLEVWDTSRLRADANDPLGRRGDRVVLTFSDARGLKRYVFANAAPGPLQVSGPPDADLLPQGEWQETRDGYRIEWRLPRASGPASAGVVVIDAAPNQETVLEIGAPAAELLPLLRQGPDWRERLLALVPQGARVRLISPEGWVFASAGQLAAQELDAREAGGRRPWQAAVYGLLHQSPTDAASEFDARLRRFKAPVVWQALSGVSASAVRASDEANTVIVSAAVPLLAAGRIRGALLLEQPSEALLVLTNRALFGVMAASLVAVLLTSLIVLAYASVLSVRIRRLRNAAERALQPDGRMELSLPHLQAHDDLGDLSRSFARLLSEVGSYTDYLKTLASKLSHELNTPLAIVRLSLDNLEHEQLSGSARTFAQRAREGAERLSHILRSMAEANRLERAVRAVEGEDFDLASMVKACGESYRDLVAPRTLLLEVPEGKVTVHGAPDLIAQALDKLIDNARSFAPEDGWIRIRLSVLEHGAELSVANNGPLLPERMQERLFDSLVSMRTGAARDEVPHLGLGLFVVRLVAEWHGGSARASNLADRTGVEVTMLLRGMPRRRML